MKRIYISPGNLRMNIPGFSLPAIKTCRGSDLCKKYCYAMKTHRWKKPYLTRKNNLKASKKRSFVRRMVEEIGKKKCEFFRIHVSGDFYSQKYVNKWMKICRQIPQRTFLVYTQRHDLDFSEKPSNLTIYYSIWPDTKIPDKKPLAFVIDEKDRLPPYDRQPKGFRCKKEDGKITCEKCLFCFRGKGDVIFSLH